VDGDVFAEGVVVFKGYSGDRVGIKAQVLGVAPDDRTGADGAFFSEGNLVDELGMGLDTAAGSDIDIAHEDGVGADLDIFAERSRSFDDGGGMDHGVGQVSLRCGASVIKNFRRDRFCSSGLVKAGSLCVRVSGYRTRLNDNWTGQAARWGMLLGVMFAGLSGGWAQEKGRPLPKWTNDTGVTIEAELLAYDLASKEIVLGKEDGSAYHFPAWNLSLESKWQLFRAPVYIEAKKGIELPIKNLWRTGFVLVLVAVFLQFLIFWLGVGAVMVDESFFRALGAFIKYFALAFMLEVFLVMVGFSFFVSNTGQPDRGWWIVLGVVWVLGSLVFFCWSVSRSYDTNWGRACGAFMLCLVIYFAMGVLLSQYGPGWLESEYADRMLTKHLFVPLEML
jgi:hypothetical protein